MNKEKTMKEIEGMGNVAEKDNKLSKYMNELSQINKLGRMDANTIKVQEFTDHKNISLWTKVGKRMGPMHRENARKAFEVFWNLGIELSTRQPTSEQIEAYKRTKEYKEKQEEYKKYREGKEKSRRKGELDRITKEIAKMSGMTVEAINNIVRPDEVGNKKK